MTTVSVFAPAKVNLALHVTGQREDGYHLIDSLVAFASVGDRIDVTAGNTLSLTVEGPEAGGVPTDMDNLALKAAALMSRGEGAALTLTKRLPPASGIGGGSADAAAAFRAMLMLGDPGEAPADTLWAMPDLVYETHARALLGLGADVPMCLMSRPVRARGIGERLSPVRLPDIPAVLVNPRVQVSTPKVFAALSSRENPPLPERLPELADPDALVGFLEETRNDLEPAAIRLVPVIAQVRDALSAQGGCRFARMSGSGATCFGLFEDFGSAEAAASRIAEVRPDWWVAACTLGDQMRACLPRST